MSNSDSINKVVCQECGHVNYIHTQNVDVPVSKLLNEDIGLLIKTSNNSGLLERFNAGYDISGNFVAEMVITETLMGGFVRDSYQHHEVFRDPYSMVTIARPLEY